MQETFNIKEHAHRRLNILTGEWVLISPHRSKRPWQGKVESLPANNRPAYDSSCYLCPGNTRADGSVNPNYNKPFAFTNDFSALLPNIPEGKTNNNNLLYAESEKGICRVICFSPKHNLTLPDLSVNEIVEVINLWQDEFLTLKKNEWIKYIQIFENKGEIMGCSNPHPHGQIWSSSHIPVEIKKETQQQQLYFQQNNKSLLQDYLQLELQLNERVVINEKHFAALVPYWAVWPYETIIISKRQVKNVTEFNEEEKESLAITLKKLTTIYDKLFNTSFPYSAGMHQQPVNNGEHAEWHWHMHFYPPLLRSATVKKFMVGYEMLASPQRDITPEFATEQLLQLI
ncbi:MAG: UDP-glucose--hexose-1-phosphate uridylyltransferase [Bacteroidetes bacterium]|nr:UDP-glucose--hexose-1-phosphate uridylyltransferase [Bacteroidota bacterium]MBS1648881.1 UDP-glucose--hexose-1-phosphate uridylyltransferase [Bacteroidota bacterium]